MEGVPFDSRNFYMDPVRSVVSQRALVHGEYSNNGPIRRDRLSRLSYKAAVEPRPLRSTRRHVPPTVHCGHTHTRTGRASGTC